MNYQHRISLQMRVIIPLGIVLGVLVLFVETLLAQRQLEKLGRGVVATHQDKDRIFISWRIFGTDSTDIAFNIYRTTDNAKPVKLNSSPIKGPSHFVDTSADLKKQNAWFIRPIINGNEQKASSAFNIEANMAPRPYLIIPLKTPKGYLPNDASVGDLDGDGEYEIILHQAGKSRDNSQAGFTSPPLLEAYKLDGTFLWRITLGKNIREGAHYTQFLVYDLDGDGKAEVVCKTADGTIDGKGEVIGNAEADHRNARGYVLEGPEFLTVFDGKTGAALATTNYIPPRGRVREWGDNYGNRVDRFLACVAYLDGKRPSVVFCRGYYTRCVLAAWDWRNGKLSHRWTFDSDDGTRGNRAYRGQGHHCLSVGDVDQDGKDEIIYGAAVIDDNGKGLYSTGWGHGDALHFSDMDPDRRGLEVYAAHGDRASKIGIGFRDAKTGKLIWGKRSFGKRGVGRACAADIDPRHRGFEMWARGVGGLYNARGKQISRRTPRPCNMLIWWDGDLLRELLDGVSITKWDHKNERDIRLFSGRAYSCASNNGSKSNPCLCADILGDWREELVARTFDGKELRIFPTTIPTKHRIHTLMHDPVYRLGVAWQNVGYNIPAHTGFYLGHGMKAPPRPNITTK